MRHVMIDLETLGTTPQSAIISIGAVYFEPTTGLSGGTFYRRVDWDQGRSIDPETIKWWMRQSEAAREEVCRPGVSLSLALLNLGDFLSGDVKVWGNGATFDISMLEDAYREAFLEIPWKFRNVRDVRTVVDMAAGIVDKPEDVEGVAHSALDDAIHQARYVSNMWQALTGDVSDD